MTCHDFQSILVDLARERDLDDPTLEAASSHTRGCGNCARALAAERELSGRLAALAAATRDASAPDRVETALLEAFRANHAAPAAEIVPIASRRPASWSRWAVAAAAGLTLAVGTLGAWRSVQTPDGPPPPRSEPSVAVNSKNPPEVERPQEVENHVMPGDTTPSVEIRHVSTGSRTSAPRAPRRTAPPRVDEPLTQNVEFASEFYPLVAGGSAAPLDGGQIIRMEVPRASLTAMGLMPSDSRANESVTADVLIGHDGMARAIRFVQPAVMTERSSLK